MKIYLLEKLYEDIFVNEDLIVLVENDFHRYNIPISKFEDFINWDYIMKYQNTSINFLINQKQRLDLQTIPIYRKLSDEEIRKLIHHQLDWSILCRENKLDENFIRDFSNKVDWKEISKYQELSDDFIREFSDKISWDTLQMYQKLSEDIMREYKDKINFGTIGIFQKLSDDFMKEFNVEYANILSIEYHCGNNHRRIFRTKSYPDIINIGCFDGTKDEAINLIKDKYSDNKVARKEYIKKVKKCFKG